MSIGANVRRFRKARELTLEDLAKAVGVSVPMICQIERGTKSLTMELGSEIAQFLDVRIDQLLNDDERRTANND